MPLKKKKTINVSPAKKKKGTDLVVKNKEKKESAVKKRTRDVETVEKDNCDDRGSSSKRTRRSNQNQERELEAPPPHSTPAPAVNDLAETERLPHSTAAPTDHVTDRHETERPPPRSTISPTQPSPPPSGSSTRTTSPELQEEVEKEIGSTNTSTPQDVEEIAVNPIRPNEFCFKAEDYWKSCKLQSRCHQHRFIKTLEKLDESEKRWFSEHPQFKHLIHMVCSPTRKVMGLWMMLIRTIASPKRRQAWFVVNGIPIRYSIREHGLISGLYCHQYPENYMSGLSMKFAEKHFRKMFIKKLKLQKNKKKKKNLEEEELKVTVMDVEEKLSQMKLDRTNDRLKMVILYFLATVLHGRSKVGSSIDPFLLQVVDDLELCETFPWGRFTFDDCINEIFHAKDHFKKGLPKKPKWTFPGFINPLEILAFECISVLKAEFREPVPNHEPTCPRMCKWKFTSSGTTGYPLEDIYKTLGNTEEICSILTPIEREQDLLNEIMDEGCWEDVELLDDNDDHDAIVDGWNKFIVREGKKIFWEDIFKADIESRSLEIDQQEEEQIEEEEHEGGNEPERIHGGEHVADFESLKEMVMSMTSQMTTIEDKINNKLEAFDRRLKVLEGDSIGREAFENMDFQYNHNEDDNEDEDNGKNDDGKDDGKDNGKDNDDNGQNDGKDNDEEAEDNGEKDDGKDGKEEAEDNGEKDDGNDDDEEYGDDGNEHEDEDNGKNDDTEKDDDEEVEDNGEKDDDEKDEDDGKDPQKELQEEEHEAGNESEKELEVQPEKEATDDAHEYTLRVMEAAAKKVEEEAARKEAMKRPKRVLKPSHLQKSPFVKK